MRAITLSCVAILAFIAVTGLAGPLTSAHLTSRSLDAFDALDALDAPPAVVRT